MTTSMTSPQKSEPVAHPANDPFGYMRDEWKRFVANFEEHPLKMLTGGMCPSLDLGETEKCVEIRMDLPGMAAEDINVQVNDNTITISGKRQEEKEEKGKSWYRVERQRGEFSRTVTLPCAVKHNDISAVYRDGVLNISLPKTAQVQTKKVTVKT